MSATMNLGGKLNKKAPKRGMVEMKELRPYRHEKG